MLVPRVLAGWHDRPKGLAVLRALLACFNTSLRIVSLSYCLKSQHGFCSPGTLDRSCFGIHIENDSASLQSNILCEGNTHIDVIYTFSMDGAPLLG